MNTYAVTCVFYIEAHDEDHAKQVADGLVDEYKMKPNEQFQIVEVSEVPF